MREAIVKRSEPKIDVETRRKLRKVSAKEWGVLEKRAAQLSPRTGLGELQKQGGRGVDAAARNIVSGRSRKQTP